MNKNKWLLIPINLGLVILPWIVGQLVINTQEGDAAEAAGMTIGLGLLVITPVTMIIGLLTTILTRKSTNAFKYSVMGFGIPTGLVLLFYLVLISN